MIKPGCTSHMATIKSAGTKHDQEKTRLDLLSPRWLEGVGKVLTFGARKYDSWNWAKGIQRSRLFAAHLHETRPDLDDRYKDQEAKCSAT